MYRRHPSPDYGCPCSLAYDRYNGPAYDKHKTPNYGRNISPEYGSYYRYVILHVLFSLLHLNCASCKFILARLLIAYFARDSYCLILINLCTCSRSPIRGSRT